MASRPTRIERNRNYSRPYGNNQPPSVLVQNLNVYVDNYRPGAPLQTAKQLADALDSSTSAMAKAEGGLFKDIREEKERKGAIAGALGITIGQVPDESKDPAVR